MCISNAPIFMPIYLDPEASSAAFAQPHNDGTFPPDFEAYLNELGESRPSVVLAFAPKAAGTYLRSAAIDAVGGQLVRTTHAHGGRDASFYLPTFLTYYAGNFPDKAAGDACPYAGLARQPAFHPPR